MGDDTPCSLLHPQATMSTKILRTSNATRAPPDEVELSVAQALIDLEASVADLKASSDPSRSPLPGRSRSRAAARLSSSSSPFPSSRLSTRSRDGTRLQHRPPGNPAVC